MTDLGPVEVELKLALPPQQAAAFLKRMARRRSTPVQQELVTRYFDSPDFALSAEGVALRVRRIGRRWLQTLKTEGERQGGLSRRAEYEMPVSRRAPDWRRFVSGLVKTLPISKVQQDMEQRETDITLETHFPEIYKGLKSYVFQLIYDKGWSPQEMEFTFEGPTKKDLFLLQTRDMALRERKEKLVFNFDNILPEEITLGHGIGVSGGAMSGRIVFTLDEIETWRKQEPECLLILIRGDTVPDDILEIHASDGLLTARGGLTSHAAVVAHRLEKTCVRVNGRSLEVIYLPAGKVRAADFPACAPCVRGQDKRALARAN